MANKMEELVEPAVASFAPKLSAFLFEENIGVLMTQEFSSDVT